MVKSIARLVLLAMAGAIIGIMIPVLAGGWYGVWLYTAKMYYWQQLPMIPITMLGGMWMAFSFWRDWVLFAAVVGGLAVLFSSFSRKQLPTHPKANFILLILLVTLACGVFAWQRQQTIKAIKIRYLDFCTAITEDQQAAYADLSPAYRQTISFQAFRQKLHDDDSAFSRGCGLYPYIPAEWDVSILGNHSMFFRNKLDFSDPLAGGMSIDLEKIDGEWYFDDEPSWYGLD